MAIKMKMSCCCDGEDGVAVATMAIGLLMVKMRKEGRTIGQVNGFIRTVFEVDFSTFSVVHTSGFGYDNGTNTIVASDDVWVDYIKNFPEVGKWRGKHFCYYDECCYIFENDRATGEDARSAADYLDPANEDVDLNDSESGGPNTVNVADSSCTRPVRSETPETSSKGRKRLSSDSRTTIRDYMLQAAKVMAVEIENQLSRSPKLFWMTRIGVKLWWQHWKKCMAYLLLKLSYMQQSWRKEMS
ncbi:hypothetical protein Sjap_000331 [Stephania japonica]|uniref:Uncharacterized protein n=1 Tax=Stephania japonica TaxID=461633 RepID=A0AAP0KHU2_9MAGN